MWPLSISQSQRSKSPQKTLQISSVSERTSNQSNMSTFTRTALTHMHLLFWQRWCGQLRPSLWCPCSSFSWLSSSVTWATSVHSAPFWPWFLESSSSSQVAGNLSICKVDTTGAMNPYFMTLHEFCLNFLSF